jgi:DNA-binding MarR family transcriptional regulator
MTKEAEQIAAWRAFITAYTVLIERIEHELADARVLPLGWYDVLFALSEAPEKRLRMHELAQAVVLSRSGLTRLVDRLEAAELLYRERTAADRRGAFAVLTDRGLAELRKTWPVYAQGIMKHFVLQLSDNEIHLLAEVFQRLLANIHQEKA